MVSAATNDALMIGGAFDVSARLSGAIVSYLIVAVLLLTTNVLIGMVVLVGVPVMVVLLGPLMRPLQARQKVQREVAGQLTALGADTVAGLRVLRGIGGEPAFLARYRRRSVELRDAGVRVATLQALLDSAQVLLPGVFLVTLTWLGARLAIEGKLSAGDIVAFYGYAFFLVVPIRTAIEAADKFTRSLVGAARIIGVLETRPEISEPETPDAPPPVGSVLADAMSGLSVEPGLMTGLVGSDPEQTAAIAHRLGRLVEHDGVTLGDVPLDRLPLRTVRHRILVSEAEPRLFTGTLRDELDPWERAVDDDDVLEALRVAAADDVLEALPDGLDSSIDEGGREFSGGQRQRLALARTLLADAEVLVLIDPTSAVDAHTEALVASRLREARHTGADGRARTTVVTSASPLLLRHCDDVVFVRNGVVEARGTHRDLLVRPPRLPRHRHPRRGPMSSPHKNARCAHVSRGDPNDRAPHAAVATRRGTSAPRRARSSPPTAGRSPGCSRCTRSPRWPRCRPAVARRDGAVGEGRHDGRARRPSRGAARGLPRGTDRADLRRPTGLVRARRDGLRRAARGLPRARAAAAAVHGRARGNRRPRHPQHRRHRGAGTHGALRRTRGAGGDRDGAADRRRGLPHRPARGAADAARRAADLLRHEALPALSRPPATCASARAMRPTTARSPRRSRVPERSRR